MKINNIFFFIIFTKTMTTTLKKIKKPSIIKKTDNSDTELNLAKKLFIGEDVILKEIRKVGRFKITRAPKLEYEKKGRFTLKNKPLKNSHKTEVGNSYYYTITNVLRNSENKIVVDLRGNIDGKNEIKQSVHLDMLEFFGQHVKSFANKIIKAQNQAENVLQSTLTLKEGSEKKREMKNMEFSKRRNAIYTAFKSYMRENDIEKLIGPNRNIDRILKESWEKYRLVTEENTKSFYQDNFLRFKMPANFFSTQQIIKMSHNRYENYKMLFPNFLDIYCKRYNKKLKGVEYKNGNPQFERLKNKAVTDIMKENHLSYIFLDKVGFIYDFYLDSKSTLPIYLQFGNKLLLSRKAVVTTE